MSRAKRVQEGDLFILLSTFMFHLLCPTRIETTGRNSHVPAPPLSLTQTKDTGKTNPVSLTFLLNRNKQSLWSPTQMAKKICEKN